MEKENKVTAWVTLIALALVWGSSFILMKRGMVTFTPYEVAALRITIAAAALFPFVAYRLHKIEKKYWLPIVVVGIFGNGIPAFLFTVAETEITSSLAGILNALTPVFTLLIAIAVFGTRIRWINVAGIIIGFGGAVWMVMLGADETLQLGHPYALLVVAATVCYAISVNVIRNYLHPVNSVVIAGAALVPVGIACVLYLLTTKVGYKTVHHPQGWMSLMYVATLAVFSTSISVIYFNNLIKMSGPIFASSVTYLIPVVALLWGVFDNEHLGVYHLAGMAVILVGVYLVNKKKKVYA